MPFSAWVSVVARRYKLHSSDRPFAMTQMFRAVWFAYAKLLYLEGDMISRPFRGTKSENEDEDDDSDDKEEEDGGPANPQRRVRAEHAEARARAEMLERLDSIPIAVQALKHIDTALGQIFKAKFGEGTVIRGDPAPEVYRRLFIQAGPLVSAIGTISAEESVLQMITTPAMDALEAFVRTPTQINASTLVEIPKIQPSRL
ncbi:hypothetical protein DFH08DRAFT_825548 [Mycena albidolilacea]|uniref:Uncharacterized protein n=1 Tax=Mycena albidolilacea TaxID=1033008 RepID=A0AAD6Z1Y8_9AGAR|nr:hypothetical protein DFH08DRAFT_825548 [Mycena albidolilacea]